MFALSNLLLNLKRGVCGVLVTILSFGYSLGLSFDFQGVYYSRKSAVTYCFYDSTRKMGQNEFIGKTATYDIHLARNESEACQIVIRSKYNSTNRDYLVEFSDFKNENGDVLETSIFEEKYIACDSDKYYGKFPDALIPFASGAHTIKLSSQKNWPFYIMVHADEDTAPGKYTASVTVKNTDDTNGVEFIANVTATVWNFTLPVTPTCDTAMGLERGCIEKLYNSKLNPTLTQQLYEKYYEFLLDHKISAYMIPYDIMSPQADKYMSDPRVKSFLVPYSGDDDVLKAYYQKITSNPEWAKKAYYYPIDEPNNLEIYGKYTALTDRLASLCPGYNMVTPANCASFKENGNTYYSTELQAGRSNIFCGISNIFDSDAFLKQIDARRKDGSKIWWYVCCGPQEDYCNAFIHFEGIKGRLLLWQQKSLNIEGLLYWSTNYWTDVVSPWGDALTTPWTGNTAFGDGSLLYNGPDGPIASLRLEEFSDGIDDFEYLTIAEQLFGREYVDKKIAKLSHSLTDYTHDDSLLARVRIEIGNDIAAAQK